MTRAEAEYLPMIELAEMLLDHRGNDESLEPNDIVDGLDRYDTLNELEELEAFEQD